MSDDERPPFDWSEFMTLAEQLLGHDSEASQRTAVSRSYYAVFHTARQVLARHDPEFASMRVGDSHQIVWQRLAALPFKQAKSVVRSGRTLLSHRRHADYDGDTENWGERSKQALDIAKLVMRSLSDLLERQ